MGFRAKGLLRATVLTGVCVLAAPAVAAAAKPFGIAKFSMQTTRTTEVPHGSDIPGYGFVNEPYTFTQAGGHPFALTSALEFASEEDGSDDSVVPVGSPKGVIIELPPGLTADPLAVSRCSLAQAMSRGSCPVDSQVGVFVLLYSSGEEEFGSAGKAMLGPIVDLTPQPGQPALFGLETPAHAMFPLGGRMVRTPRGYGLALAGNGLPASLGVVGLETTLWGVPAAAVHDPQRGLSCSAGSVDQEWRCEGGGAPSGDAPAAFLTMPAGCSAGPQSAIAWTDSWEEPGRYVQARSTLPGVTGCDRLPFDPEIEVQPDTLLADEPVGVGVNIRVGQTESTQVVATSQLRDATVALPEGMSISPSIADGLRACEQAGPEGIDIPTGLNAKGEPLGPGELGEGEEPGPNGEPQLAPGHCPEASTIGSAEALTPLLPNPIQGHVYLAVPGCGGPDQASCTASDAVDGNLYRLYLELGGSGQSDQGVDIKLEGKVEANPATGQLTLTLMESPQLSLSRLKVDLTGGPRALLDNPATCGPATTTSDLSPWSAPGSTPEGMFIDGTPNATPSSFYEVTGCAGPAAFSPGFLAGTVSLQAGGFSALTLSVTRRDREQSLQAIQLHTPPGLSAMLSSVPMCEEALANAGKCPEASRIGSSLIAAGAGTQPFQMPGSMYLTKGYEGAPFGLSIVTDAVAGPLNLGLIVVRARIEIDPETAALTITSDPLPQILLGIPLRLRMVTLDIDRPDFIFNPTNCNQLKIEGTIASNLGTGATVSSPFQVANCAGLPFGPKLTASTQAKSSRRDGASLVMSITAPGHGQADLRKIQLQLPSKLPPRFSTIQTACTAEQFNANPAGCPQGSNIGTATVATPLLRAPLTGPVYFVSHPGPKFPELIMVVQGEGITLDISAETVIGKAGATTITAPAVPDMPFTRFTLSLPEGPHSALAAPRGKLCQDDLVMPTALTGQNGALLKQNTKIKVTGCKKTVRAIKHNKNAKPQEDLDVRPEQVVHAGDGCLSPDGGALPGRIDSSGRGIL